MPEVLLEHVEDSVTDLAAVTVFEDEALVHFFENVLQITIDNNVSDDDALKMHEFYQRVVALRNYCDEELLEDVLEGLSTKLKSYNKIHDIHKLR